MNGGLWKDHEATPRQAQLVFGKKRNCGPPTQADVIVQLLREKRALGQPLELPEIMALGIAQHGTRIFELRDRGFVIENQQERSTDGRVLSRYWLRFDPERDSPLETECSEKALTGPFPQFGDLTVQARYRDDAFPRLDSNKRPEPVPLYFEQPVWVRKGLGSPPEGQWLERWDDHSRIF